MPEFKMNGKQSLEFQDLSEFTRGYIEAAFFTEEERLTEELGEEMPAVQVNLATMESSFAGPSIPSFEMLAPETLSKMIEDCAGFELANKADLDKAGSPEQNGHDFWLTRNHHGVGFWDRGYPEPLGDKLTKAAQKYCEVSLYVGDDRKIYCE